MLTTTRTRIGAALAAAFVLLILVGNSISTAGTSQDSHPSGQQVLSDIAKQAGSASAVVGFVMEVLGFVAFLVFLGYLAATRREGAGGVADGPATATAVVAGSVMLAIKLGSVGPMVALQLDHERLSPDLAQVLNDMNSGSFVVSWLPFAVFTAAVAVAWSRRGLVGRPTLAIGVALGVLGVASALVGLRNVADGNPMPFLLSLLWLLVVSVRLVVRPGAKVSGAAAPETSDRATATHV